VLSLDDTKVAEISQTGEWRITELNLDKIRHLVNSLQYSKLVDFHRWDVCITETPIPVNTIIHGWMDGWMDGQMKYKHCRLRTTLGHFTFWISLSLSRNTRLRTHRPQAVNYRRHLHVLKYYYYYTKGERSDADE